MHYLDNIIERGSIFLLVFTPLAFGTVQPWSISIMELAAFIIFGAWLMKLMRQENTPVVTSPAFYFAGAFIGFIVLQLVPMPQGIMGLLSPSTGALYSQFAPLGSSWRTFSINPDATKEELYKIIAYAALFIVIINYYKTREQIKPVVYTIISMGCFLAIFAIAQKLTWTGNLYWIYPSGVYSNRDFIWGPYINHNHFAGYMEMAIFLALGMLLYRASKVQSGENEFFVIKVLYWASRKEMLPMTLLSVAVILMSGALFVSLSRGGIMGFTAAILLFGLMIRNRRYLRKKTGIIALTGLTILMTVVFAGWESLESRFQEIGEPGKIKRTDVWRDSLGIISDFPVTGTGLGTFMKIYPKYQTRHPSTLFEHAENDYIEILTDTGIAGFALAMGLLLALFYTVMKAWRERHSSFVICVVTGGICSCMAIAFHGLTDFNMRIPANALTVTVIAAITYATVFNVKDRRNLKRQSFEPNQ